MNNKNRSNIQEFTAILQLKQLQVFLLFNELISNP